MNFLAKTKFRLTRLGLRLGNGPESNLSTYTAMLSTRLSINHGKDADPECQIIGTLEQHEPNQPTIGRPLALVCHLHAPPLTTQTFPARLRLPFLLYLFSRCLTLLLSFY